MSEPGRAFRIEPARPDEAEAIASLDGGAYIALEEVRAELERPWSHVRVARENSEAIAGFVIFWHVADELHILHLATRAARRKLGIGRALMEDALAFARDRSVRCVVLEVRRSNAPAVALYESLGFASIRVRERYYPDGEDALDMLLSLLP